QRYRASGGGFGSRRDSSGDGCSAASGDATGWGAGFGGREGGAGVGRVTGGFLGGSGVSGVDEPGWKRAPHWGQSMTAGRGREAGGPGSGQAGTATHPQRHDGPPAEAATWGETTAVILPARVVERPNKSGRPEAARPDSVRRANSHCSVSRRPLHSGGFATLHP